MVSPTTFALVRSPAPLVTFPAPASSNAACGFPALRPASRQGLCGRSRREPFRAAHSSRFLLHLFQPCPPVFPPGSAFAFTYILCLRSRSSIGAFLISPLPPCCQSRYRQQGRFPPPALPGFTGTTNPSATLSPVSRLPGAPGYTAYLAPPISRRGRGGLLQLLSASSLPCRRYHPAGVPQRLSQSALRHAAFVQDLGTQPPSFLFFEATCAFTLVTARQLAGHPLRWPCQWASGFSSFSLLPAIHATGLWLLPRRVCPPLNALSLCWMPTCTLKSSRA